MAALSGLYYLTCVLTGSATDVSDFLFRFFVDPSDLYLMGRALTATMGVATVALVYRAGALLDGSRAGLSAAVLAAGAFLHVRDSHFITVDVPATFWAMAALTLAVQHLQDGRRATLISASFLAGLSASTKYNAILFLPALLFAALSSPLPGPRSRWVATALGAWALAFAAGSPFVVLAPSSFWADFSYEWQHFGRGHGVEMGNGWLYHLTVSLRHGLGWPLLSAGMLGMLGLLLRRRPADLLILSAIVAYYVVAGGGGSLFIRYIVPLVPLLCLTAGSALARGAGRRPWLAVTVALLVAAPTVAASVAHVRLLARQDTRVLARRWIERNVSHGATVAFTGSSYGQPQLRPTRHWIERQLNEVRRAGEPGRRLARQLDMPGFPPQPAYDLVQLQVANPQHLTSIRPPADLRTLRSQGVEWLVVQRHPLTYSHVPSVLSQELKNLDAVVDFDPYLPTSHEPLYDPIDAYFLPMTGHEALQRPGPRLTIYRVSQGDTTQAE